MASSSSASVKTSSREATPNAISEQASRETTPPPSNAPTKSVPTAAVENAPSDSSKLKTFLSILKRFIGVSDMAAVRFSLPAQLMEPIPNLEYWQYLDRPETFVSIPDADDPLGRMLGTLRFWLTKDLKYIKGKPCKPYNSVLSEFFRCNWEVEEVLPPVLGSANAPTSTTSTADNKHPIVVSYLTEQTSHHPPVSAYYVDCPAKGISARGFDQLSAKFTGTSVRVIPGEHNKGIFITIESRDNEEYQLTHPAAYLGGFLRGSLYVTVSDTAYICCAKTKIKVILQYMEESWLGRTQNRMEGVVFNYDPSNDKTSKIKDVKDKDVLARIEGCWTDKIYYSLGSTPLNKSTDKVLLVDVNPLFPVPKIIPPADEQLPNESPRFWQQVTAAITEKRYGDATTLKQQIEQRQRDKTAEREARKAEWRPRFFTEPLAPKGKPELSQEGKDLIKGMQEGNYHLEESKETGA
ncbi:MAG: hypothetical protein M1820_010454 [Bogoriella megaspora]|nr:MAG: hypothetical protein M1820_010454 [Bogoriella megaspora]